MTSDSFLVVLAVLIGIGLMVVASRIRRRSLRRVDERRRPRSPGPDDPGLG